MKKFVKAFHWPSQSNWTSQRLVVLIARRNVMSWLLAKANVMKNGQMLSNQQLSPIFNTGHYSTMFWNASKWSHFNLFNIWIWKFPPNNSDFNLDFWRENSYFWTYQMFVHDFSTVCLHFEKISCLFTFQGIMSAVCFNLRNIVSCLFIIKNETFLVIFAHCELSYSMLHFCQIAILLHISILKNVFSPFSHPNSSWTRMPANRWCPSLLLFPPTVRERLILNSQRLFKRLNRHSNTLFSISNSQIFDSELKGEEFLKDDQCFCSFSYF